jgi:hypothetical protein
MLQAPGRTTPHGGSTTGRFLRWAAPPLLRWRDRRPSGPSEIHAAQARILRQLLHELGPTESGRANGLGALARLPDQELTGAFRELPISRYADIARWVERCANGERDLLFPGRTAALAQTSGTTSAEGAGERYIPQNQALLAHHSLGGAAALARLTATAGSESVGGRMLMLGGSTRLSRNARGIPFGDLSGIAVSRIPWFLQPLYEPGRALALESDWNTKVRGIARRLSHADVRLVTGIPSWCQILFEEVCRQREVQRVSEAWPGLRAFVHGGVAIDPYIPLLAEQLPPDTWMMEVYPASEVFLAVGERPWHLREGRAPDLELLTDHGSYLEFLPEEDVNRPERAVGAWDLEVGGLYRVLATTPGGLLRYELGDMVEGRGPGMVRFAGRVRTRISVFGEHVEATRLAEALAEAARATESVPREWHVAPVLPSRGNPQGRHEWWVEFQRPPSDMDRFERVLDDVLRRSVLDYEAHRTGNVQLLPPRLVSLPEGTFLRALARRGKLGGQNKVPAAWNDRTWAELLEQCIGEQE